MDYSYARISTPRQNIERQIRNIKAQYPDAVVVKDTYTGTKMDRPAWSALMDRVKSGDRIIFDSVSRMSRDAAEGCVTYERLFASGVELIFLKEPQINTRVYQEAIDRQIDVQTNTGDKATDEFIQSILAALNKYAIDLAKRQIELAFEQAEKEVKDLHQRTREGMETARLNNKQIGQVPGRKLTTKKSIEVKKIIRKHAKDFGGGLKDKEVIALSGVNPKTYYKYKQELLNEGCS